ncbi:hypothetical protein SUGI_1039770 [Cryptomeria japonica]|nr:hypothetical protein SUGI_1039770 [Cryptomeria japonica]
MVVHLIDQCPNFNPRVHSLNDSSAWIRLYNLPREYQGIVMLKDISKGLGAFISVDEILEDRVWGSFARICIRINSTLALPNIIEIHGDWKI